MPLVLARARPRRVLAILCGAGLALLVLELVLQAAAFVLWQRHGIAAADGRRVALCIGDSFTWGLGTSRPGRAYPAAAERLVQAAGVSDLSFVNAGWPGRTSRDVLEGVVPLLRELRPELVYVLVGINDTWSWPDRLPPGREHQTDRGGFPLRWRTARLARLLSSGLREAGFLGAWETDEVQVDLWPGGIGGFAGQPLTWREVGDRLVVRSADGQEVSMQWRRDGDRLELSSPSWPAPVRLRRGFAHVYQPLRKLPAGQVARSEQALARVLAGEDPDRVRAELAADGTRLTPELLDTACAHLGRAVPPAVRERMLVPDGSLLAILDDHLRRLVHACTRHGATPVLLTYPGGPFAKPEVEAVVVRVAREERADLIDLRAGFTALTASGATDVWASDGHCNDNGYAAMAEAVAAHALARRAR